jgi:septal ring factor EnvC (AmiA/AmiB activator)
MDGKTKEFEEQKENTNNEIAELEQKIAKMNDDLNILAKKADIEADVASKYAKVAASAQMGQYVNGTRKNQPIIETGQINAERTREMNRLKAEQTQINTENQKATANRQAVRNAAAQAKQAAAQVKQVAAPVAQGGRRRRKTRRAAKKHGTKRR